jgi:hypothetical protein
VVEQRVRANDNQALLRSREGDVGAIEGVIIALLGVIYWGVDSRLKSLEDQFRTAIVASGDVKKLLDDSPDLKKTVSETHDAVMKIQDGMTLLNPVETHDAIIALKPVPKQLQDIKTQLDSMQLQIHHPGKNEK